MPLARVFRRFPVDLTTRDHMPAAQQTYSNHRRFLPLYHFVVMPLLIANTGVETARLLSNQSPRQIWSLVVAVTLLLLALAARLMALIVQNRLIRLEERLRLASILPESQRSRIGELRTGQLIGLRFASDEEVPALAQRCLDGELQGSGAIKKAVRNWRPDHIRV